MQDFDVLLPVYEKDDPYLLDKALHSVVKNSYVPANIVIAIDGPICETLTEVISRYDKDYSNIVIIQQSKNLGLAENLNKSIRSCTSNIIIRCDADDFNLPDRFEKLIDYLRNNREVGVVSSAIREINFDGASKIKTLPMDHSQIKRFALWRNPINHMAVAFRREIFSSIEYPNIRYKEDYALWLNLLNEGIIFHNLQDILVDVTAGSSQLQRRRGLANIMSEIALFPYKNRMFGFVSALVSTIVRSMTLILPLRLLRIIYGFLRNR